MWRNSAIFRWFVRLWCPCMCLVAGAHGGDDFAKGNELYDAGKFKEAREIYAGMAKRGEGSANLFYNLGNAEFRAGELGRAILNFERALRLEPGHPEATANLKLARERTHASVPARPFWQQWALLVREPVWTIFGTISAWAAVFIFVALVRRPASQRLGLSLALVMSVLAAGIAAFALIQQRRELRSAIIVANEAGARLAPAETATLAQMLPAGSEVRTLSTHGQWTYCELDGARRGWILSSALERIFPEKT